MGKKLVLGKTPEDLRAEEAAKQREIEAQVQSAILDRQAKLEAMHKKQKKTKILVITWASVLSVALLVFGTYNTFFKHDLTVEDVQPAINQAVNTINFPAEGLDNYLRVNCTKLFEKYMTIDSNAGKNIKSVVVDENSCNVKRVKKLSTTLAQVWFAVDVLVTENDVEVTDPELIRQFKQADLIHEQVIATAPPEDSDTDAEGTDDSAVDDENGIDPVAVNDDESSAAETTDAATTETQTVETAAQPALANSTTGGYQYADFYSDIGGTEEHYYVSVNGKVMKTGTVTRQRYNFYLPIELYYQYDSEGKATAAGFRPAGEMTLYTLNMIDVDDFAEITPNELFICDEEFLRDKETTNKIQIKVEKTLQDLYEGRDTSQDFYNYITFNSYDARFNNILSLESYDQTNALGMNTHVIYSITTTQGFNYTLDTWILVEEDGNSWVIKGML